MIKIRRLKNLQLLKQKKLNKLTIEINTLNGEIKKSNRWNNQFDFFNSNENVKSSWFGLPVLINKLYLKNKQNNPGRILGGFF